MTVTLLDAILIGIMLVSALLAMVRGFSREVLSIVSWVVAAIAAYMFYEPLTPYAREYINSDKVAMAASAAGIFIITLIIVSFITLRIADFIIDSRIGALDRALGFAFGAVRGLLLVVVAMLFFNWLAPQNQPAWVAEAKSKPFLDDLGQRLVAALPENPEETILDKFRNQQGGETPAEPGAAGTDPAPDQGEPAQDSSEPTTIEGAIGAAPADEGPADDAPAN
ncbi:CvpA family protein [Mangrovicella endophytica]|uniref:CvpA family protein n=1 Tax=Mangrovicella endophytica TaxID=2066697 RepID=UPI000C9E3F9D|nr:CvpA family protein [Mangrovicella endophytica]